VNDFTRQKLREIILQYGRSLCDDPRRCEALLRDFCGQYRQEVSVLVSALKERVAEDLLASPNSVPSAILLARLTKRLQDDLGLTQEAARWAVESWALALGVISEADAQSVSSCSLPSPTPLVSSQPKPIKSLQTEVNSSMPTLNEGIIGKYIRNSNRNLLVTNLCILLVLIGIGFFNGRYLYNFLFGPFQIDHETISSITQPDILLKYYVTLQSDKSLHTGYQEKKRYRNGLEAVEANYIALVINRRLLLVKASANYKEGDTKFTGAIVDIQKDVRTDMVDEIETNNDLRGVFLPYMLDATGFRSSGYWELGIGIPLLLLSLWNIKKTIRRGANPNLHPITRSISKFGLPREIAAAIDSEVKADSEHFGSLVITSSWLLRPTGFDLDIINLGEIVWVYKKVTTVRKYGIPVNRIYSIMIHDRRDTTYGININSDKIDEVIEAIFSRVPWVITGFDKELEKLWHSNRSVVLDLVDKRKQNFLK
jgi:hypothetical protein